MKIIRDGKEIELTAEELRWAYDEQEHLFDIDDVVNELKCRRDFDDTGAIQKVLDNPSLVSEIAYEKRKNIDEYEMGWFNATITAVSDILKKEGLQ